MVEILANEKRDLSGFGQRLRALRVAAGLTQEGLAEKTGLRYQLIAKYERGATDPSWATALKLADALGVSLDDFRAESDSDAGE